jgi:hypothetical protein
MTKSDIEKEFNGAAEKRFCNKTKIKESEVICIHKRYDFNLCFQSKDYELYKEWEIKIGAYRMYNSLVKFKFGDRLAKVNQTNNRLEHKLLELPKECLRFLRVEGETLAEFDLKNSQPCILMNALFGDLYVPYEDFQEVLNQQKASYYKLVETFKNNPKLNELVTSAYSGKFYETLQRLSYDDITRDESKKATMFVLFSGFNSKWNASVDMWKNNHPELYGFIKNLKKRYYKVYKDNITKENSPDYDEFLKSSYSKSTSFLPVTLQKLESFIFLDHILVDILKNGLFTLSKHDAVLCKKSDADKIRTIMEKNLKQLLGVDRFKLDFSHLCSEDLKLAA